MTQSPVLPKGDQPYPMGSANGTARTAAGINEAEREISKAPSKQMDDGSGICSVPDQNDIMCNSTCQSHSLELSSATIQGRFSRQQAEQLMVDQQHADPQIVQNEFFFSPLGNSA